MDPLYVLPEVQHFMAKLEELYPGHNPLFHREHLLEDKGAFVVQECFNRKRVKLISIRTFEHARLEGHGSRMLRVLCALADAHGIEIELMATSFGQTRPKLTTYQLRRWYKRHGFKSEKLSRHMERLPYPEAPENQPLRSAPRQYAVSQDAQILTGRK